MSNAFTDPVPLDVPLDAPLGRRARPGFQALQWLRTRLFRRPEPAVDAAATLAGFSPTLGRGCALRRSHQALHRLFARQEGLRHVLPHLNLLERALGRKGSLALLRLPEPVLQRALEQLEDLQTTENNPELAALRTRLVESLALRSVTEPLDPTSGAALTIAGLEVREASHSAFDETSLHLTASMGLRRRH